MEGTGWQYDLEESRAQLPLPGLGGTAYLDFYVEERAKAESLVHLQSLSVMLGNTERYRATECVLGSLPPYLQGELAVVCKRLGWTPE